MSDVPSSCPDDDLLVDLALGNLDGRERSEALAHVTACAPCSARVRDLVDVSEQLLAVAPSAEPPVGFETETLRRLRAPVRRRRLLGVAAAAVILVFAVVAGVVVTRDTSEALAEASMVTAEGRDVGSAWIYDDEVSWLFVSVPGWKVWEGPDGSTPDYWIEATLADGSTSDLGAITFHGDQGSWATTLTIDSSRIESVAVVDDTGRVWCEGRFG